MGDRLEEQQPCQKQPTSTRDTTMQAFDLFLYAIAIIAVLIVRAESTPATVAPAPAPEPQPIEAKPEPQPIAQPAKPATIAPPVVSLVIPTEAPSTDYSTLTSAQLRKECTAAGIRWRNAHAKGRHLSKGEMIAALA
jgi:hypothetical protein